MISCYNEVVGMIEKATKEFAPELTLDLKKFGEVKEICIWIDTLIGTVNCDFIDIEVDRVTRRLTVRVVSDDAIFQHGRSDPFFTLIKKLNSFSFSRYGDEDKLAISLHIDGLWASDQ